VDGRNPAPVDGWFIPLFIGFQPSKVMQDFFHPQYVTPFTIGFLQFFLLFPRPQDIVGQRHGAFQPLWAALEKTKDGST
jgi:hypothetical protein